MTLYILLGVLGAFLLWTAVTYNLLVRGRQHVRESWADIDTELKRRYDLIPNLVEAVRGYAVHERQVLTQVTECRARAVASHGRPGQQAEDEKPLVQSVQRLLAVAEGYPELKASENFLSLQNELSDTEDRIQAARRFYNGNVRDQNTRIESFPSNIVAGMCRFEPEDFFEVESAVIRQVVDVSFGS